MTLQELNSVPRYRAEAELIKCCGSAAWVRTMTGRRPFANRERLLRAASEVWWHLDPADWLEAFRAHPQIGQQKAATLTPVQAQAWSAQEQSGMSRAGVGVTMELEEANQEYLARFGYIFIVSASGKSADQVLSILKSRLANPPETEIRVAAEEQDKITRLRLDKLVPL
ncbi:MAG TPA: 2-oxo-4-hydroxy-4-carboxy-5-ureidoimidazoline decarboxylase [Bryobacteraceae bacterium]|nr:2-oxo-4-hydroxy-4-carboxy-5-ureidoimidazoline decarboxylase [Bryobacteraceae bacterium]